MIKQILTRAAPILLISATPIQAFGENFSTQISSSKDNRAGDPKNAQIHDDTAILLIQSIKNQLRPYWISPKGEDADKLATILTWDLNRDGSLSGEPKIVRQTGITAANRGLALSHALNAIRALRHAAPFHLPAEYYDTWKHIGEFRFSGPSKS